MGVGLATTTTSTTVATTTTSAVTTTSTVTTTTLNVIATDNFESYPSDAAIIAPWTTTGPTRIVQAPHPVHGGLQSFSIANGGSASTSTLPVPSSSSWTLDIWIYIEVSSGNVQYVGMKNSASGTGLVINAATTGAVTAGPPAAPWSGISATVSVGAWHHYTLRVVQALAGSASLTIDGASAGTFSGDTRDNAANTTSNQVVAIGTGIGPSPFAELYLDDLTVGSP